MHEIMLLHEYFMKLCEWLNNQLNKLLYASTILISIFKIIACCYATSTNWIFLISWDPPRCNNYKCVTKIIVPWYVYLYSNNCDIKAFVHAIYAMQSRDFIFALLSNHFQYLWSHKPNYIIFQQLNTRL